MKDVLSRTWISWTNMWPTRLNSFVFHFLVWRDMRFLLKELVYSQAANQDFTLRLAQNRWSLIGGVISFGISAALALQHRIFATDVVACMLDHLRYRAVKDQPSAEKEASDVRYNLKWSGRLLVFSALFLGLGAGAVVYTFVRVLWP